MFILECNCRLFNYFPPILPSISSPVVLTFEINFSGLD